MRSHCILSTATVSLLTAAALFACMGMGAQAATVQCSDGMDNDFDGAYDYPADFGCSSASDENEGDTRSQCQDGTDNDGDGYIDMNDGGCTGLQDNSEGKASVSNSCDEFDTDVHAVPLVLRADAGQTATFQITVKNDSDEDCLLDLHAEFDPDLHFLSANHDNEMEGKNHVVWRDLLLKEESDLIIRVQTRIDRGAINGDILEMKTTIEGSKDTASLHIGTQLITPPTGRTILRKVVDGKALNDSAAARRLKRQKLR